ncbi:zinc finger CCCH domain-containing protein 67-like isoform X2 [Rutidosis leptorrhynchoides]|uniref:zinc finger CCCH domain-containing protein 67-like isoform X2 n=1 Tax=Rutidosis leptorrhynchoides TaxID=125765 RepID=UPI003A9A6525
METLETKSQLNNQPIHSQSDLSSRNTDEIVSSLAQELETLVFSNSSDRDLDTHSDGWEQDPDQCSGLEQQKLGYSDDWKEQNESEFVDGDMSSDIRVYDSNGDEWRINDEHDPETEGEIGGGGGSVRVTDDVDGTVKSYHYPVRPDAEDCSYYIRTGMCKFGLHCKFNHPLRRRNQPTKEIKMHREDNMERHGQQIECKYYLSTGGCKYGKSCKYNHTRVKTVVAPVVEYNFLGLPIRLGEKECPYYMRNGSCKYGPNCRFNHPDPTAVGGDTNTQAHAHGHGPTTYGNDGPVVLQSPPQPSMGSWSAPRTPDPNAAFVPMMYSPTQNMPPPNSDWNGYQATVPVPVPAPAHVYPSSERGLPIPPAFFLNNPPSDTNMYTHHQQQMPVSDYPERPGQPDCSYFMKTGDCKYRTTCKFNHPKSRSTRNTPSVLSDKGLPLRPDQSICSHYSRYGICKYGPACKYDHPVNYSNSRSSGEGY